MVQWIVASGLSQPLQLHVQPHNSGCAATGCKPVKAVFKRALWRGDQALLDLQRASLAVCPCPLAGWKAGCHLHHWADCNIINARR